MNPVSLYVCVKWQCPAR